MQDPADALPAGLVEALRGVRSVGVITGAGVSQESGIPTYRGSGGIYDDPEEGDRTVEALSGTTLRRDPDRTWRVVAELARRSASARPNPGHHAIVELERKASRFILLTQNVDGLHQRAGSRNVIAIHGDVFATLCQSCGRGSRLQPEELIRLQAAPRCPECQGVLRPDAVLFGEMLPADKLAELHREFILDPPDLVIAAGTSALFPYIVQPVLVAREEGRLTVEVNPEPSTLSAVVDHWLQGTAGSLLPLLAESLPGP